MSDKFAPISIELLTKLILHELQIKNEIFGLPAELFRTGTYAALVTQMFGQKLGIPLGVAAGPHSQMTQNIISAWLCGARYIELKTIQTLDELEVPKPCIDMQDEGYNCEWSQELKMEQSFNQYLDAWILIHILNHKFNGSLKTDLQFNMSIGYNMEGILNDNVQWFLSKMQNCETELNAKLEQISKIYPQVSLLSIPHQLSNSITLSTMHGCPPNEIEEIASYLIETKKLHTFVKLNPTLLGSDKLRTILNKLNRFKTEVPDIAFEHDLAYADAVPMIKRLQQKAEQSGVDFGLKLTNTLESKNHKPIFQDTESMMYMSGRALHPLSVNLALQLQQEFNGALNISFAGGADCFNISHLLACGFTPVTVCSDILKPGGYGRLPQYIDNINQTLIEHKAGNIEQLIQQTANENDLQKAKLKNLEKYVNEIAHNNAYKQTNFSYPSIKTEKELGYFDCVHAPCQDACATHQNIPDYLHFTAKQQFNKAFDTIMLDNPQPAITGHICDHLCQLKCTRINYDQPLLIREIKRFVEQNYRYAGIQQIMPKNQLKVAIIGAGPSGLACAYYLLLNGFAVELFDQKENAGGMVSSAVPSFRIDDRTIKADQKTVEDLGGIFHFGTSINSDKFNHLQQQFNYVYIASGAQKSTELGITGEKMQGVSHALNFLYQARKAPQNIDGKHITIIGGGNSAMDAARTAYRLVGKKGSVSILYRRTIEDMPADLGEIKAVIDENIQIIEQVSPIEIMQTNGAVSGIKCIKNQMVSSGGKRNKPVAIPQSEFTLSCQMVIIAIGQQVEFDFLNKVEIITQPDTLETNMDKVFMGGDAYRGAATAIKAIADGKKAAQTIIKKSGVQALVLSKHDKDVDYKQIKQSRYRRINGEKTTESDLNDRQNFKPVNYTISEQAAVNEASRCLQCDTICNVCVTVCPNRANFAYKVEPRKYKLQKAQLENDKMQIIDDKEFTIAQAYQILNIANFCNECGNCTTFCPTSGMPFRDKPRVHLSIQSFNTETEGFYLSELPNKKVLIFKEKGGIRTLEKADNKWIYETDHVWVSFKVSDFSINEAQFKTPCVKQAHFTMAAEMSIIYEGIEQLIPLQIN